MFPAEVPEQAQRQLGHHLLPDGQREAPGQREVPDAGGVHAQELSPKRPQGQDKVRLTARHPAPDSWLLPPPACSECISLDIDGLDYA